MSGTGRIPPSFVPTLTEVVGRGVPAAPSARWQELEDQLLQRVLQRVDLVLERRLREALAQVLHEQTQAMLPRLRDEIEAVVRRAINDAVAQELESH